MINQAGIHALMFFVQALTTLASHRQMAVEGQYSQTLGASITAVQHNEMIQDACAAEFRLRLSLRDTLLALRPDLVGSPFDGGFDQIAAALSSPAPYCDKAHTQLSVLLGQLASWSERPTQRQSELPPHHHS